MLLLLFLVIVPSAIGVYYLLKPPITMQTEMDSMSVTNLESNFIGMEDIPSTSAASTALLRQQIVNK